MSWRCCASSCRGAIVSRAKLDRATFRVMGNEVLLDIARTAPRDAKQLSGLKGMPRGILERGGAAILSAVAARAGSGRGASAEVSARARSGIARRISRRQVAKLKTVRDAAATRLAARSRSSVLARAARGGCAQEARESERSRGRSGTAALADRRDGRGVRRSLRA